MSSLKLQYLYNVYRLLLVECYAEKLKLGNLISPTHIVYDGADRVGIRSCFICCGTEELSHLHSTLHTQLASCFHIQITDQTTRAEICSLCIKRLADAQSFRNMVERVGRQLTADSNRRHDMPVDEVKREPSQQEKGPIKKMCPPIERKKFSKQIQYQTEICIENDKEFKIPENSKDSIVTETPEEIEENYNNEEDNSFELSLNECLSDNNSSCSETPRDKNRIEWYDQDQFPQYNTCTIPVLGRGVKDCPNCDKTFKSRSRLKSHFDTHYIQYLCQICGKLFTTMHKLKCHVEFHEGKRFSCAKCPKSYGLKEYLVRHMNRVHERKLAYSCPKCEMRFSEYQNKRVHMFKVHGVIAQNTVCKICQKWCKTSTKLNRHMLHVHIMEMNNPCSKCDKVFPSTYSLRTHMKTHSDGRKLFCNLCGKGLKNKKSLKTHLDIHYDIRRFHCEFCGKSFVQGSSLKWHLKTHHHNKTTNATELNMEYT